MIGCQRLFCDSGFCMALASPPVNARLNRRLHLARPRQQTRGKAGRQGLVARQRGYRGVRKDEGRAWVNHHLDRANGAGRIQRGDAVGLASVNQDMDDGAVMACGIKG